MSNTRHSIVLEPLAMEEVRTVVEHMAKIKQRTNDKRFVLRSETCETEINFTHTLIEASVANLNAGLAEPVRIYETTYVIDKTSGDIAHDEKCIQELLPEHDGNNVQIY